VHGRVMLLESTFDNAGDPVAMTPMVEMHVYDGKTVPMAVTVILLEDTPDDCDPGTGRPFDDQYIFMEVFTPPKEVGDKPT